MPTALIVDDSKLARIVSGKALAELQPEWNRVEAGSAAEALSTLDSQSVDLVLIDFNMPDKDGLELATELRERFPTMPLAIITANVQDVVIARSRAINATFVPKPVTVDGLRGFISGAALRLRSQGA